MSSQRGHNDVTIWRIRDAFCVSNAICTYAHAHTDQYVILIALPQQQRFYERSSMLRYTYIACLVVFSLYHPKQEIIVFSLCFQAILDTEQHSISYTLSRTQAVIVEYMPDEDTDMFQVRVVLLHRFCDTVLSQ